MAESFAEYAIAHEAGHAVVGQWATIGAPAAISFYLHRGSDGQLYLGDFATSSLFPPDDEIAQLPESVKNCLCYILAGGLAGTDFSGLSLPDEHRGLDPDRERLSKLTSKTLESFVPFARAIIDKEQKAYREIVRRCTGAYDLLRTKQISEGKHALLDAQELQIIFKRTLSPPSADLPVEENTEEFRDLMSAHEAGHATLGISLGARIEAVYAILGRLQNGNVAVSYKTRFGRLGRAGLGLKDQVLLTAGAAAAEVLLIGRWDHQCVQFDKRDLEELGFWNFGYCVEEAIRLLEENKPLLIEVRNKIWTGMSNFKECKLARKGTHVILAKGAEIEKLFRTLGFRVSSSGLDLDIARVKAEDVAGI